MSTADDAATFLLKTATSGWIAPTLWLAVEWRIPDLVAAAPRTADELAELCNAHADSLRRMLDALSSLGVFTRDDQGRYGASAISSLLCAEAPASLAWLISTSCGGENYDAWSNLEQAVRTGDCAFLLRHGMTWLDYHRKRPDRGEVFARAMTAMTRASESALLAAHDFGDFSLAVDVGGSQGSLVAQLLVQNPSARGIVFDLPETIARVRPSTDRLEAIGGDFFVAVPAGDLYLLKIVLHDWQDAEAILILKSIRRAVLPNGRVAIIETLIPDAPEPHYVWGRDIAMLALTGGRERTLAQYRGLLSAAGFSIAKVTQQLPYSVIEGVPASPPP
jgi:hypothetical protein